jgi:hypothetical protein
MNYLQKVIVVDNGERALDCALSAELAEMGLASVTASVDAADDVLELIPSPAAIVLKLPGPAHGAQRKRLMDLAERLRARSRTTGIPVILVEPTDAAANGGFASVLQSELGTRVLSGPDL